jgi:hypothetical protein
MINHLNYRRFIVFASLVLTGLCCFAQGIPRTTVSLSSVMVGYEKHSTLQMGKKEARALDFLKANNCEIVSYKLCLVLGGQKSFILVQGDSIPSAAISEVKTGDKISFENIQAKCGKEQVKPIKGATIKVM